MIRKIIKIDNERCNGCGLCVEACHEGAIGMIDGKATILRDDYCDGLGDCLPVCPTEAISFEEREAAAYDDVAVKKHMAKMGKTLPTGGCPGSKVHVIDRNVAVHTVEETISNSSLMQWPVQIKLVPTAATYFDNANILIAADCSAYAYAGFHNKFMKNKITLIGCPKLDAGDYSDKLTAILTENNIKSVTVVRMEVPCCGGIEQAAITALKNSGKMIPWQVITISTDGRILNE